MSGIVEVIMNFADSEDYGRIKVVGQQFECDEKRCEFLMNKNAVKLINYIQDEITEEVVQAVANAIVEEAEERNKDVETIVEEIIDESVDEAVEEVFNKKKKTSRK